MLMISKLFDICKQQISKIPASDLQDLFLQEIKKRKIVPDFSNVVPNVVRQICLSMNLNKNTIDILVKKLNEPLIYLIMYYPYLRSKQFELRALKEFAQEHPSNGYVIPIIEPVKGNLRSLTTAIRTMSAKKMIFSLILNPTDGDFQYKKKDILSEIEELQTANYIPAFL